MKRMYSAVPGRVYVATRAHSASGDRELSLSKGDKVKGEIAHEKVCPSYQKSAVVITVMLVDIQLATVPVPASSHDEARNV